VEEGPRDNLNQTLRWGIPWEVRSLFHFGFTPGGPLGSFSTNFGVTLNEKRPLLPGKPRPTSVITATRHRL
jgi:hypothetical protein